MKIYIIELFFLFIILFEGCNISDPYIENELGNGYFLFADPYEILFSKNGENYEFVIRPHVVSYAYDSSYIIAKTQKSRYDSNDSRFWIVDKKDTNSPNVDSIMVLPDHTSCIYSIKGSVRGPYDSLPFIYVLDSLNIKLKMNLVEYQQ